ncbi:MAG: poly-gamma-glutamate synthase PgsB [Candidatus Eisenbacteria bacterium]
MIVVPAALLIGLTTFGVLESRRHAANLASIPLRIHVNGTRGKSSVTRLIAAGLRAGGVRTFAKTTGTMARMILPDGAEVDVYRPGRANIIEQIRIVRRAVDERAEALVIECMAVAPELQPITERRLVRSTIGVITNVRADHLDVMGPTVEDAARVLAQTMPVQGIVFTAERERRAILEEEAAARGTMLRVADASTVTDADLARFSYVEHAENVALALDVCARLGVGREAALAGMAAAAPDPGVLRRVVVRVGSKEIAFVNAFAANDPDSTRIIWERLGLDRPQPGSRRLVLANCRSDRLQRSEQIATLVARTLTADHVVLSGEGTAVVAFKAVQQGLDPARLTDLGGRTAEHVYERILALAGPRATVVGIGNIVGLGQEIVLHFQNRAERP